MIPKIIHYCWFGHNPKPKLAKKCIKSWRKFCSDYTFIEWNEDNFDIASCPLYVRQAYEAKKWAFVTDYVRLKVVFDNGGIYLDTDVELIKPLDELLKYDAYLGFEDEQHVNTGLGFGSIKGLYIIKELLDDYNNIPFVLQDGSLDTTACPKRNTKVLLKHNLVANNSTQFLDSNNKIIILNSTYLCPINYWTKDKNLTSDTLSIHHFSSSWQTKKDKKIIREIRAKEIWHSNIHIIKHLPNLLLKRLIGEKKYAALKDKINKR